MGQSATAAPLTFPKSERSRKSSARIRKKYPPMCTVPPPTQHAIARWERAEGRRGPAGPRPKYTLSGLARCGVCGGRMHVGNSKAGKEIVRVYYCYCAKHRDYGIAACSKSLRGPVDTVDDRVLTWIENNVLTENVVLETL